MGLDNRQIFKIAVVRRGNVLAGQANGPGIEIVEAVLRDQGKELSTNNLLDLEAALATVREFGYGSDGLHRAEQAAAVVVKHTNPCGVAVGDGVATALTRALDGDRIKIGRAHV